MKNFIGNFFKLIKSHCHTPTIPGLKHVLKETGSSKFFWFIILLTLTLACIYACSYSVLQYYKFNIKPSTTVSSEIEIQYPAMTFCHQMALSKKNIGGQDFELGLEAIAYSRSWAHYLQLLKRGEDNLTTYKFGTKKACHTFCKTCGVQSFYTPRSNPDGKGIAPHCIDEGTVEKVLFRKVEGKNWEKAMKDNPDIFSMSKD